MRTTPYMLSFSYLFLAQYKRVGDIVNYSSEASPDDVKLAPKSIVALEGMSIVLSLVKEVAHSK